MTTSGDEPVPVGSDPVAEGDGSVPLDGDSVAEADGSVISTATPLTDG